MTEHRPLNTAHLPLKLRVEDYLALDREGAFTAYEKTELIAGEILFINAQHRPHALAKMELYDALRDALRGNGATRPLTEATVAIPPDSAPEPDIVVTSEPLGDGPIPVSSVALAVEVSDATLAVDLNAKRHLYATAEIPEYWVVDLTSRIIHRFADPKSDDYRRSEKIAFGTPIECVSLDITIDTARL